MKTYEFLAEVRDRGGYADQQEAESVTREVLSVLGKRLGAEESRQLAAQLPAELKDAVIAEDRASSAGVQEFIDLVQSTRGAPSPEAAREDATAVLATVATAVTGGELNNIITRLPAGYAELFGHPELS